MKNSRIFLSTFGALALLLASACAPAVSSSPPAQVEASATPVSVDSAVASATPLAVQPEATLAPTEAALPVATSRGPDLEATDPTSVKLASGQLQLVEFFRFT